MLLDELMVGMSSAEEAEVSELIRRVRRDLGLTVLIVEHDIPVIMNISDKIVVLDFGRKIVEGTPLEVRANPAVIAAYLGDEVQRPRASAACESMLVATPFPSSLAFSPSFRL